MNCKTALLTVLDQVDFTNGACLPKEVIELARQSIADESTNDEYNSALEWAASWITGAQMLGRGAEIEKFAHDMAMSIRAAKRPTKRALDKWRAVACEGKSYTATCQ